MRVSAEEMIRFIRSSKLPFEKVGTDLLVVDAEEDIFFSSNAIGAFIWEELASPQSHKELCDAVCMGFEVVDVSEVLSDVEDFVNSLLEHKLVEQAG